MSIVSMKEFRVWRPLRYMPRKLRNLPGAWWRWRRAGRPVDEPVVREQGRLVVCPHGQLLTGWVWETRHQSQPIGIGELAARYEARYGSEAGRIHCCPDCIAANIIRRSSDD